MFEFLVIHRLLDGFLVALSAIDSLAKLDFLLYILTCLRLYRSIVDYSRAQFLCCDIQPTILVELDVSMEHIRRSLANNYTLAISRIRRSDDLCRF